MNLIFYIKKSCFNNPCFPTSPIAWTFFNLARYFCHVSYQVVIPLSSCLPHQSCSRSAQIKNSWLNYSGFSVSCTRCPALCTNISTYATPNRTRDTVCHWVFQLLRFHMLLIIIDYRRYILTLCIRISHVQSLVFLIVITVPNIWSLSQPRMHQHLYWTVEPLVIQYIPCSLKLLEAGDK